MKNAKFIIEKHKNTTKIAKKQFKKYKNSTKDIKK